MPASRHHPFQTDDPRLKPIHGKVLTGERLIESDALTLYRTGDILAVGWMANYVRERMHGDKAFVCLRTQKRLARRLHHGA
jgi:aminodeoxyfutalosine synthase